jgi:hypothetical protein
MIAPLLFGEPPAQVQWTRLKLSNNDAAKDW